MQLVKCGTLGAKRHTMTESLSRLIEMAKSVKMTGAQKDEQRRSFVFGNTGIENKNITEQMVSDRARVVKPE
jgi:hypothetical protein